MNCFAITYTHLLKINQMSHPGWKLSSKESFSFVPLPVRQLVPGARDADAQTTVPRNGSRTSSTTRPSSTGWRKTRSLWITEWMTRLKNSGIRISKAVHRRHSRLRLCTSCSRRTWGRMFMTWRSAGSRSTPVPRPDVDLRPRRPLRQRPAAPDDFIVHLLAQSEHHQSDAGLCSRWRWASVRKVYLNTTDQAEWSSRTMASPNQQFKLIQHSSMDSSMASWEMTSRRKWSNGRVAGGAAERRPAVVLRHDSSRGGRQGSSEICELESDSASRIAAAAAWWS